MKHGSLFSGIGGFDLAAEWMGWENVFHCEWNEFGQKVLKHYWPKAISYEDITKTDFTIHRGNIDILTGGFPCQPYSSAGKRLGKEDERHLWPEMLRAIREIKPRWVVGENVYGLVNWSGGLVFHEVQADLEAEGYEVQPYLLPAVSVNAPHRRDRIWFVAYATRTSERADEFRGLRCKDGEINRERSQTIYDASRPDGFEGFVANSESSRSTISKLGESESRQQIQTRSDIDGLKGLGDAADTMCKGLEWSKERRGLGEIREESHEFSTRCFRSKWEKFPSVSPICNGNDGFSDRLDGITFPKWRNESIKAGGNAVCPPLVYQIFKTIEQYEHQR